jgi:microsomal dipeptidase-like Zn-dependent dipeptidase
MKQLNRRGKPAVDVKEFSIIDLHCHPSLKMYLLDKDFWRHHCPQPGANEFHQQIDLDKLSSGYVKGLLATHYLVEAATGREWDKLKRLVSFIQRFLFSFWDKIEHEDYSNFTQINIMIDKLESQIHITNQKLKNETFVIARSYEEFKNAINKGQIPLAHAIEGAHALGRKFPISDKRREIVESFSFIDTLDTDDVIKFYKRNLEALKNRGVCMITLAHIFPNDIADPVEGISPDEKKSLGMHWEYDPLRNDQPMREIGVAVVKQMLDYGIIVDLTHSTSKTRKQIFAMNLDRKKEGKKIRPLTFSHVGSQHIFETYNHYKKYEHYKYYDVNEDEINSICKCDGVIGIIPENFWLVGADTHLKEFNPDKFRKGIPFMIETMKYINSQTLTKDYDNIAIGSDFDGFADSPEDFFIAPHIARLLAALKNDPEEFTDDRIKKIFYLNAQRLLENGWGSCT